MALKNGFLLYGTQWDTVKLLSQGERAELLEVIYLYHIRSIDWEIYDAEGNPYIMSPKVELVFSMIKTQFEIDEQKYEKIIERNKNNWKKGGRPKVESQKKPKKPSGLKKTQQNPVEPKKADNDNDNDLYISWENNSLIEEYIEVKEFIDTQKNNITWVKYQIDEKWDEYYKKQYEEYEKLLKEAAKKNLTRENMAMLLDFIPNDPFRKTNIGSIIKLRSKNKEWVPYRVVMIGQMQKKLQSQRPVYDLK